MTRPWPEIRRVFEENFRVYGVRKVWRQLQREGIAVARCTVERLMRQMGLQGVMRGKPVQDDDQRQGGAVPARPGEPAVPGAAAERAVGGGLHLCRDLAGFVYVAFVIDAFARRIVGWRVSRTAQAELRAGRAGAGAPDRRPVRAAVSSITATGRAIRLDQYTERLAEAGIEPSVGSVGDSYDNALAETIIGLYKTEVIRRRGPWRSLEAVEFATLEWVDWFNHRRLLEPIGNIPPAEAEADIMPSLNTPIWQA